MRPITLCVQLIFLVTFGLFTQSLGATDDEAYDATLYTFDPDFYDYAPTEYAMGTPAEDYLDWKHLWEDLETAEVETSEELSQVQNLGKVQFTCSRRELWLEGEDLKLGPSRDCSLGFAISQMEGHRENWSLAVSQSRIDHSQAIQETLGLSEETLTAALKARVLPWLRTTLIHYQAEPPGDGDTFKFWAAYGTASNSEALPVDSLTLGQERDNSSTLSIAYFQKNLGQRDQPINTSLYGGVSHLDQSFRSGAERQDVKWLGAVQINLNKPDQSMILGFGDEAGGPMSYMVGFHGRLLKEQRNEWMTTCRVRQVRDASETIRKTEFCIIHIGIGDGRLAGRGRYVDFLGTFVPGMIKPTRIVNGSTLSENPISPSAVQSLTNRALWSFVATHTDVEITDQAGLRIESAEIYRKFPGQHGQALDPYIGLLYMGTNYLYFDAASRSLKNTDLRQEIALALGSAFGSTSKRWETEVRLGWDVKRHEPTFRGSIHRFFGQ